MDRRYRQFKEVHFEAYGKSEIDKSVLEVWLKKSVCGELEQIFSMLPETVLYMLTAESTATE